MISARRVFVSPIIAVGFVLLGLTPPTWGWGEDGSGIAQPTTYTSPSGRYALFIDPAVRYGTSSAVYELRKTTDVRWSVPPLPREVGRWRPFLVAGGTELILYEDHAIKEQTPAIRRFALP